MCLHLAANGGRSVAPNPMVGSVIVHDGKVIGEGFHEQFGGPHAEVNALRSVTEQTVLKNSTLYVNLEPCCHQGKTPPCVDAIINAGIPRVVIGHVDPNPAVSGNGIETLRAHGIEVRSNILEAECIDLNKRFVTVHQKKRPYIILKWAQTNDGFIARTDFSSKWISCEESRQLTHQWRGEEQGILVGTNTALHDDPQLTVRHGNGISPLRIVLDRYHRLPLNLQLLSDGLETWIFSYTERTVPGHVRYVLLHQESKELDQMLRYLANNGISSLLVEGGSTLHRSFIDQNIWDEARIFVSPTEFQSGIRAATLTGLPFRERNVGPDKLREFVYSEITSNS